MSDNAYFLIMILFPAVFLLAVIYRFLSKRYNMKFVSKENTIEPSSAATDIEKEFDDDPVINPAYSFSKLNVFHKDHSDDKD